MINDEALAQTKSLSTQLSLTTNQRNPACLVIAGNTGNVVCNTSFTNLSDSRVTEMAEADVAELQQLFDSAEAKQYKRPDMNGDLRLASPQTTLQERSGRTCRTARWSDGTETVTLDYSHLTSVLWGVWAEEPIRNMAARRRTIKAVYEDPRTGFGSIAQTLQQAQVRNPNEVKAFLDGLQDRPQRGYNSFVPLEAMNQLQVDLADMDMNKRGRGAAEGPSCDHHRGGHEEGVPSFGCAGQRVLRRRLRVQEGVQGADGFLGHREAGIRTIKEAMLRRISPSRRCCMKEPHFPEAVRSRTYEQAARTRPAEND